MKTKSLNVCFLSLVIVFTFLSTSCKKDKAENLSETDLEINQFIWGGLNYLYLWVDNVPELQSSTYQNEASLNQFLNKTADHEALFNSLLYQHGKVDKWSWIVDDYTELENQLQGISKTNGMDFRLGKFTGTNNVFGFVRYVMKGSPADRAGVKRGNVFTLINSTQLTLDNYLSLLFNNDSYTVAIDTIINQSFAHTGRSVNLTAIEFQENPIYLDTVYTVNNKKVGYLVYNSFINKFSSQLNDVFQKFKTKAIDELILDLRYNPGGDETNMIGLASMIYTTNSNDVFMQLRYNTNIQSSIETEEGTDYLKRKFTDNITYIDDANHSQTVGIGSLNLNKLHVITSSNTASAGEVLMCGLKAYIPVVLIGDTTEGKYVGSTTVHDYIDNEGTINPDHKWAMQPIIMKVANKNGVTDYIGGYIPDIEIIESIATLNQLGNVNEPLLKKTLNYIAGNGQSTAVLKSLERPYNIVADSKDRYKFIGGLRADRRKLPPVLQNFK
jgi:carboxyl-terminal processing protease